MDASRRARPTENPTCMKICCANKALGVGHLQGSQGFTKNVPEGRDIMY